MDDAGRRGEVDLIGQGGFIERRQVLLRVLVGLIAAVSAALALMALAVLTMPAAPPFDPVTGLGQPTTHWESGVRGAGGGSFGLVLRVVAPGALAVTLLFGRWWRSALAAVTVYSVHWLGGLADQFQVDLTGTDADYRRIVQAARWSDLTLGVALVLGCWVLLWFSPGEQTEDGASRWEAVLALGGLALLPFTWAATEMYLENAWVNSSGPAGMTPGTEGSLQRLALTDLAALTEHPLRYASHYLPVGLVVLTVLMMFSTRMRRRPRLRVEVWMGLAAGVVADVVKRAPFWYDETIGVVTDEASGVWSPNGTSLALLVLSAVAFVLAAWLAKGSLDAWRERAATDEGNGHLEPLEVWSLD